MPLHRGLLALAALLALSSSQVASAVDCTKHGVNATFWRKDGSLYAPGSPPYYDEYPFSMVPDAYLATRPADNQTVVPDINFGMDTANSVGWGQWVPGYNNTNFVVEFDAYLLLPWRGDYTFYLSSSDQAQLSLTLNGTQLALDSGAAWSDYSEDQVGTTLALDYDLSPAVYKLHVKYHKASPIVPFGPPYVRLEWSYEGLDASTNNTAVKLPRQVIDPAYFYLNNCPIPSIIIPPPPPPPAAPIAPTPAPMQPAQARPYGYAYGYASQAGMPIPYGYSATAPAPGPVPSATYPAKLLAPAPWPVVKDRQPLNPLGTAPAAEPTAATAVAPTPACPREYYMCSIGALPAPRPQLRVPAAAYEMAVQGMCTPSSPAKEDYNCGGFFMSAEQYLDVQQGPCVRHNPCNSESAPAPAAAAQAPTAASCADAYTCSIGALPAPRPQLSVPAPAYHLAIQGKCMPSSPAKEEYNCGGFWMTAEQYADVQQGPCVRHKPCEAVSAPAPAPKAKAPTAGRAATCADVYLCSIGALPAPRPQLRVPSAAYEMAVQGICTPSSPAKEDYNCGGFWMSAEQYADVQQGPCIRHNPCETAGPQSAPAPAPEAAGPSADTAAKCSDVYICSIGAVPAPAPQLWVPAAAYAMALQDLCTPSSPAKEDYSCGGFMMTAEQYADVQQGPCVHHNPCDKASAPAPAPARRFGPVAAPQAYAPAPAYAAGRQPVRTPAATPPAYGANNPAFGANYGANGAGDASVFAPAPAPATYSPAPVAYLPVYASPAVAPILAPSQAQAPAPAAKPQMPQDIGPAEYISAPRPRRPAGTPPTLAPIQAPAPVPGMAPSAYAPGPQLFGHNPIILMPPTPAPAPAPVAYYAPADSSQAALGYQSDLPTTPAAYSPAPRAYAPSPLPGHSAPLYSRPAPAYAPAYMPAHPHAYALAYAAGPVSSPVSTPAAPAPAPRPAAYSTPPVPLFGHNLSPVIPPAPAPAPRRNAPTAYGYSAVAAMPPAYAPAMAPGPLPSKPSKQPSGGISVIDVGNATPYGPAPGPSAMAPAPMAYGMPNPRQGGAGTVSPYGCSTQLPGGYAAAVPAIHYHIHYDGCPIVDDINPGAPVLPGDLQFDIRNGQVTGPRKLNEDDQASAEPSTPAQSAFAQVLSRLSALARRMRTILLQALSSPHVPSVAQHSAAFTAAPSTPHKHAHAAEAAQQAALPSSRSTGLDRWAAMLEEQRSLYPQSPEGLAAMKSDFDRALAAISEDNGAASAGLQAMSQDTSSKPSRRLFGK